MAYGLCPLHDAHCPLVLLVARSLLLHSSKQQFANRPFCGPTVMVMGDTTIVEDKCWATLYDRDRHILTFPTNRRGRANVWLSPHLAVGPTALDTAERIEVRSGDALVATGVLEERGHP